MSSHNGSRKRTILCVEDDRDTCDLVTFLLPDYQIVTTASVEEGLKKAREGLFDSYLLDNWLPDGSGVELCREIRRFDRNTPIIFLSAVVYEKDKRQALDAGAQVYLTKPVEMERLQRAVSEQIFKAEMRSLDAKVAEIAAIRDSIADHLADVEKFRIKQKACRAFINSGGTRIAFERLWPEVCEATLSDIKAQAPAG